MTLALFSFSHLLRFYFLSSFISDHALRSSFRWTCCRRRQCKA
jgi:hypothetical protein